MRLTATDDAELELWGARRRRELFEKVFARELELVRRWDSRRACRRLTHPNPAHGPGVAITSDGARAR